MSLQLLPGVLGAGVDFSQPWHWAGPCSGTRGWRHTGSARARSRQWSLMLTTAAASSAGLREDFGNGDQFYARAGEVTDLSEHRADRPNRDFLEWHLDEVFKAS